jgi:hypothetical protein
MSMNLPLLQIMTTKNTNVHVKAPITITTNIITIAAIANRRIPTPHIGSHIPPHE